MQASGLVVLRAMLFTVFYWARIMGGQLQTDFYFCKDEEKIPALTKGGMVEYKATLMSQKSTEIVVRGNGSPVCLVKASDETFKTQPGLSA